MKRTALLLALLFALLGGVLASCKQTEGNSCSSVHDCADGLICCFDGTHANEPLGVCRADDECTPLDGGVTEDATP